MVSVIYTLYSVIMLSVYFGSQMTWITIYIIIHTQYIIMKRHRGNRHCCSRSDYKQYKIQYILFKIVMFECNIYSSYQCLRRFILCIFQLGNNKK